MNLYGKRCYRTGRSLFLTAEENFEEAFEVAKQCDAERERAIKEGTADKLPQLHGIPISVKDLVRNMMRNL